MPKRNHVTANPGINAEEAFQRTVEKWKELEKLGYTLISKCECDLKEELKANLDMQKYFNYLKLVTPWNPEKLFSCGGSTNSNKLYHECTNGKKSGTFVTVLRPISTSIDYSYYLSHM